MPGFDMLFLVDESGSMDAQVTALKDHVDTIFNALNNQTVDSRAGLVGFGAFNNGIHKEQAHVHERMTKNVGDFQTAANELVSSGGREPSCEALIKVLEAADDELDVGLKEDNKFCVALITDEISNHDDPDYDEARAISALTTNNAADSEGTFFGIMPDGAVTESFQPLVNATDGYIFDKEVFLESPATVLQRLVTKCNVAVNRITMEPLTASLETGQEHEITIKAIMEKNGTAVVDPGERIMVKVVSGPGVGTADVEVITDSNGEAVYKYTSTNVGKNVFEACLGEVCAKKATAEWIDKGSIPGIKAIEVGPRRATLSVGDTHNVTAFVFWEGTGTGIQDESVWLNVICGPHKGANLNAKTNSSGKAVFEITSEGRGRDIYEACLLDNNGTLCGELVSATFVDGLMLTLSPDVATRNINKKINLTATLTLDNGTVGGKAIAFDISSGPHTGKKDNVSTGKLCIRLLYADVV
jgi:hypothetical protein